MRILLLLLALLFSITTALSQNKNFWKTVNENSLSSDLFLNRVKPSAYKVVQLNEASFKSDIIQVLSERLTSANNSSFIISIPNAEGEIEQFTAVEAPVMDPALSAKYPEIKSYLGKGINNPTATIRFDISPRGFHGMVSSANRPTFYIDPLDLKNELYIVFSREHALNLQRHFNCGTDVDPKAASALQSNYANRLAADDGKLRTYRLALACTGEYSQYFLNGTETTVAQRKGKVLAAMNTLLTRTDHVYERDFGIRMVLIANNDAIIYLNASRDPWTNEWNTKTQRTIDAVIGNANYDIGHLVHKEARAANNNGNAGCIGCVCKTGSKGSAFTSHVNPENDPFVIDYTTHEMGHQFGANHTFTFRDERTKVQTEPGSGSTIMGYAGITGSTTDVQPHSDDYFHSKSIEQVTNYIKSSAGGGACAVVTATGNTPPSVNAGADYTIPKSTPFILKGTAADAEETVGLHYNWEQIDNFSTRGAATVPSATATKGPVFRSYNYTTNAFRTIPRLSYILSGANGYKWEVLPSVARTLNFRFTARDNHSGGGNNNTDDKVVTVSTAGPFAVTAPNTAVKWRGGATQTISWSVNSTNRSPVNCTSVKISLSTDGGQTFPIVLLASTPNDGSEPVMVPNVSSATCRVKIEAVGNIFFDICNANFSINSSAPSPSCGTVTGLTSSITSTGATVRWSALKGAVSYDVDYRPNGSATWISAVSRTTATSISITGLTPNTLYNWRVRANCSGATGAYATANFTTASATTTGCQSPLDNSTNRTISGAATIPLNSNVTGLIRSSTDKDYYRFVITRAGTITVTLSTLPKDYDLRLFNSQGRPIAISEFGGTASESINYNAVAGTYYALVYGYSGVSSTTLCYTLKVQLGTASRSFMGSDPIVKINPNPATNILNVSVPGITEKSELQVMDARGKLVIKRKIKNNLEQVDISGLARGLYIIITTDGKNRSINKFIKQ